MITGNRNNDDNNNVAVSSVWWPCYVRDINNDINSVAPRGTPLIPASCMPGTCETGLSLCTRGHRAVARTKHPLATAAFLIISCETQGERFVARDVLSREIRLDFPLRLIQSDSCTISSRMWLVLIISVAIVHFRRNCETRKLSIHCLDDKRWRNRERFIPSKEFLLLRLPLIRAQLIRIFYVPCFRVSVQGETWNTGIGILFQKISVYYDTDGNVSMKVVFSEQTRKNLYLSLFLKISVTTIFRVESILLFQYRSQRKREVGMRIEIINTFDQRNK